MSVGPLALELIVVFCVALFLLHHYGRISKQHPVVTIATLIAWYFSLIIVFILPLDVSSTFYRQCVKYEKDSTTTAVTNYSDAPSEATTNSTPGSAHNIVLRVVGAQTIFTTPGYVNNSNRDGIASQTIVTDLSNKHSSIIPTSSQAASWGTSSWLNDTEGSWNNKGDCEKPWSYVPETTLPAMWHIVYWSSQVLTWLVLPFMQSYSCAGDFSVFGKFKRAVIENAVYYGTYLLLFGGLLIYVAASPDLTLNIAQLKVILITAANTWGLFLLVLLLGYGLVEVPRGLWHASNLNLTTAQTYFKLAKLSTEKQEASEDLDDILEEVRRVSAVVRYNHPVRKYVNIIISKSPDEFQTKVSQGMDDYEDYDSGRGRSDVPSEKSLVRLHRQLISSVHTHKRTSVQWNILMQRAIHLENISKSVNLIDRHWKEEFPHLHSGNPCSRVLCTPTLLWHWYCSVQPKLRKALAGCLAILSLMVVWSECTFFNENPVLSLFAIFINLAKKNYDYFYIELASCLIISYLCICAYYTVFRIKFFNYYYIAGHHQTDESSLLFVGIMLCRLTAPLCLNFLGLIHLDTHITGDTGIETSYTEIMGHLDVISFISDGFNVYFPILVCVLCVATYFNLGQRCLSAIGFQRFIDAADDMTTDLIDEGKQLVNREKRRLQRDVKAIQRAERQSGFGLDADMNARQWSGKTMRNAEAATSASTVRYNKQKNDKVELLDDVGPIDYNSVADSTNDDPRIERTEWERSSRWGSSSYQTPRSNLSGRPPKNIFDDV